MKNISFEKIQKIILDIVKKVKHSEDDFSTTKYLASQGVDSLDMFDILVSLQKTFDIEVDIEFIEEEEWSAIDKIAEKVLDILAKNQNFF